jgi:uncharacterized repeat protein (TIGR01451 family)
MLQTAGAERVAARASKHRISGGKLVRTPLRLLLLPALACLAWAAASASAHETPFERCLELQPKVPPPTVPVEICTVADVARVTTYTWGLTKAAQPPSVRIERGESVPITYEVIATPAAAVRYVITGTVHVRSFTFTPVTLTGVNQSIGLVGGLSRGPVPLGAGDELPARTGQGAPPTERAYPFRMALPASGRGGIAVVTTVAAYRVGTGAEDSTAQTVRLELDGPGQANMAINQRVILNDVVKAPPGVVVVPAETAPVVIDAEAPSTLRQRATVKATNTGLSCADGVSILNFATLSGTGLAAHQLGADTVLATAAAAVTATAADCPLPPGKAVGRPPPRCPRPTLEVILRAPLKVRAGGRVGYLVRVRNSGRILAQGVRLSVTLPAGFSATRGSGIRNGVVRQSLGALRPGRSASVRVTLRADRGTLGERMSRARATARCGAAAGSLRALQVLPGPAPGRPPVTG